MSKGPFGLKRLSDALAAITPKKIRKQFVKQSGEEDLILSEFPIGQLAVGDDAREESSFEISRPRPFVSDIERETLEEGGSKVTLSM